MILHILISLTFSYNDKSSVVPLAYIMQDANIGRRNISADEAEALKMYMMEEMVKIVLDVETLSQSMQKERPMHGYMAMFYLTIILAIFFTVLGCITIYREEQSSLASPQFILRCFVAFFDSFANMFIIFNIGTGLVWFVLYMKDQQHYVDADVIWFWTLTILAAIFKGIALLYKLHQKCAQSVFFIGWESTTKDSTSPIANLRQRHLLQHWKRLFASRRTSPTLNLLLVSLIFNLFPSLHFEHGSLEYDELLTVPRFGLQIIVWVGITLVQQLFLKFVWERRSSNRWKRFVNENTECKSSTLVFTGTHRGYFVDANENNKTCSVNDRSGCQPLVYDFVMKKTMKKELELPGKRTTHSQKTDYLRSILESFPSSSDLDVSKETLVQSISGLPPSLYGTSHSVFRQVRCQDALQNATLAGLEWSLTFFEILLYLCCDYTFGNRSIVSFTIVWFASKICTVVTRVRSAQNLNKQFV
ncbi:putative Meckelin (Transmembrane protein 67) [Blattamonas nauphoetae]|uniref:Meckelin (Transmembrane protein 67) n=1 Tax=Blattamonas nauphoetae TaxID=2049346 RepID=A0ABQ9YHR9_9EUKA|nr:putative Meckelin (Transmembrane protein 67) [Blattamonas nauphoetae]